MINRCAYLDRNHMFNIRKEETGTCEPDEVLVKIMANGICGSDVHFYVDGRIGNFFVEEPYIPGHEASGRVVVVGRDVRSLHVGDRVVVEPGIPCGRCALCRSGRYNLCPDVVFLSAPPVNGTFQDYVLLRQDAVHRIPDSLSFEHAALVEPAAVAVHAVNRACFSAGDDAVVIGAGPIGLLTMQAFKAAGGGSVTCIDRIPARLSLAGRVGADCVIDLSAGIVSPENLAKVVFETAGADAATSLLFRTAKPGGCAVQVGWPQHPNVPLDIFSFLDKELDYVAVNRYANSFPAAISWLDGGRMDAETMITHRFPFSRTAEAFAFAVSHQTEVVKILVLNEE